MTSEEDEKRLAEILEKLKDSTVPVDEQAKLYTEATEITARCESRLEVAERVVQIKRADGSVEDFE